MKPKVEKYPACYGTGRIPKTEFKILCPVCGGTGKKLKPRWSLTCKAVVWER